MTRCAWCGRDLKADEVRRVPPGLVWLTAFAMAFFHGGLWASELRRACCPGCLSKIVPLALVFATLVLAAAAAGIRLWLRGP